MTLSWVHVTSHYGASDRTRSVWGDGDGDGAECPNERPSSGSEGAARARARPHSRERRRRTGAFRVACKRKRERVVCVCVCVIDTDAFAGVRTRDWLDFHALARTDERLGARDRIVGARARESRCGTERVE